MIVTLSHAILHLDEARAPRTAKSLAATACAACHSNYKNALSGLVLHREPHLGRYGISLGDDTKPLRKSRYSMIKVQSNNKQDVLIFTGYRFELYEVEC